jgi:hypothetical protein
VIAPRFETQTPETSSRDGSTVINHFHLNIPDKITDAIMAILGSMTGQPALFQRSEFVPTTTTTTQPGQVAASSSAATRKGHSAEKGNERGLTAGNFENQTAGESLPKTMLELMESGPLVLRRKRAKAGADQRGKHCTSCRAFDRFWSEYQSLHRFTEPVQTCEILRDDEQSENPVIRRAFAMYWIGQKTKAGNQVSSQTILSYWQHVCMVVRAYGVTLPQFTRDELDLLRRDSNPASETQAPSIVDRICPTREEIDAMCLHATAAATVYGQHAGYLFRLLIRFFACFGLRKNDFISTKPGKKGLLKQDIVWSPECPDPNVNAALGYTLMNPGGWLWIRVHKSEKKHVAMLLLPIPLWARGPLQFFCELSQHPEMVFPSLEASGQCLAQGTFSLDWNSVLTAAGVDPTIRLSEGRGGVIALRKYSYNWWRLAVQKMLNDAKLAEDCADYIMHHASITKTTAQRHYAVVRATVLPTICKLLPEFPKPAADALPVSMLPE